jgi:DNA repair protein RecO
MRHKYATTGIVIGRVPVGEASAMLAIVSKELGFLWARAQSVRMSKSKLSHALQIFCESEFMFVEGKQCWKVGGAVLVENYGHALGEQGARHKRELGERIIKLFFSLVHEATPDARLYPLFKTFCERIKTITSDECENVEYALALALLYLTGYETSLPVEVEDALEPEMIAYVSTHKKDVINHINRGIAAARS